MIVRPFALLLCCVLLWVAASPSRAAEPARTGSAGATIVLQLPSSMPPEVVRAMLAELAAKGARAAAPSPDPPPAGPRSAPSPQPVATGANFAATVSTASAAALAAVPRLAEAPRRLAVTNFSRDWAVVKFNLHLEPTVNIETVRRTIKHVGEVLLEDPEVGGEFIQPLDRTLPGLARNRLIKITYIFNT